ncbi:hypothetical protein P8605_09935 [Streptomyces sp. T-3]|nr:hypothetical protein [Streptomyces sp. T-3]
MSSATFHPSPASVRPRGATAVTGTQHKHRMGNALRAVKVFAGAAVGVVVLGEYAEETEAGVRRHR